MIAGRAQGAVGRGHGVGERARGGDHTLSRDPSRMVENAGTTDEAGASRSGGSRGGRLADDCSSEEEA